MLSDKNEHDQSHYNQGGMIAFIGSMAFTILFFIYVSFVHRGVDLQEIPEEQAPAAAPAEAAPPASAPETGAKFDPASVTEPWVESPELIAHGAGVFKMACVTCHGEKGLGDGPAGANLNPPAKNLVEGKWKVGGDSLALFNTLTKGIEGTSMASFSYMPVVDRWALVHYVRSITKNKVADDVEKLKAAAANLK